MMTLLQDELSKLQSVYGGYGEHVRWGPWSNECLLLKTMFLFLLSFLPYDFTDPNEFYYCSHYRGQNGLLKWVIALRRNWDNILVHKTRAKLSFDAEL